MLTGGILIDLKQAGSQRDYHCRILGSYGEQAKKKKLADSEILKPSPVKTEHRMSIGWQTLSSQE
jgi:hypothetical protein